jgi:hypothetical protein
MGLDSGLIDELLKGRSTVEDIAGENGLLRQLTKAIIERALRAELTTHLGYEKHSVEGRGSGNSRNGASKKRLRGDFGTVEIEVPRDRAASFEPQLVPKGETRWHGFDEKILSLYARGMTTREIQGHLEEMYQVEVSPALISNVTEAVMEEVKAWQSRPLDGVYPIVYLDALVVKMRVEGRVRKPRRVCGDRHRDGWPQGGSGPLDIGQRRREVLAAGADGAAQSRGSGHLHRLRGRAEGLPAGHRNGLPEDDRATLHRAHGAGQLELRELEAAGRGGRRSEDDLPRPDRGRSRTKTERLL